MSKKTTAPSFIRTPASVTTLENRVATLVSFNNELLSLLVTNLPALKEKASELQQGLMQAMQRIDVRHDELVLSGHGPVGVAQSLNITSEAQDQLFQAKCFAKPEVSVSDEALRQRFMKYFALPTEQGLAWVVPDTETYGDLVRDGQGVKDANILAVDDGIYILQESEQNVSYTVVVSLPEGKLLFSPAGGVSFVSLSKIENQWISHRAASFIDGPSTEKALDAFFDQLDLKDVTADDLKELVIKVHSVPKKKWPELAHLEGESKDLVIDLGLGFKLVSPCVGDPVVTGNGPDAWNNASLPLKHQLFRQVTTKIDSMGGKTPTVKAVKKTAEKKKVH